MKWLILVVCLLISQTVYAGSSTEYDGGNDETDWGNVLDTSTGNRTLCVWAKMVDDAEQDTIAGKLNSTGSGAGYLISQRAADDIAEFMVSDNVDDIFVGCTSDIDGVWYFICGGWEASSETATCWQNGVIVGTVVGGGSMDSLTNTVEFAVGEDGAEGNDALMDAAYITTSANIWDTLQVNQVRWHPEGRAQMTGPGATLMICPLWDGDANAIDIALAFNGTATGTNDSSSGPPVMIGAVGMSY